MPRNPSLVEPKDKSAKSSSWNLFSKNKRKSTDLQTEAGNPNKHENLQPPPDSAYGSSIDHSNSMNSETNTSGQYSLQTPSYPTTHHQPMTPTNLTGDDVQVSSNLMHSGPTIRKETHHNPATGTTITTTVTTTTTTTIVAGPNGTTTIEEPRVELPGGRTTPTPPQQSEAVVAAIQHNGNGNDLDLQEQQRTSVTPGQRPIPYRDPKSMSDLRHTISREDQPANLQQGDTPAIPFRSSNRLSYQPSPISNNPGQTKNVSMPSTSPLPSSHNFSRPGGAQTQQGDNLPEALRIGGRPGSTLENLKTAAAGIHGAAETLRGTVSSTADRRLRPGKATEADLAKHQEVINNGKYEIENRKFAPRNSARPPNAVQSQPSSSTLHPPASKAKPSKNQLRRQSWENRAADYNSAQGTGGSSRVARWLHKANSHPNDKGNGAELRESTNF